MAKLLLVLVILSSSSLLLAAETKTTSDVVRDIGGRSLQRGTEYYILPVIRGRGGGLTLASRNNTCPLFVAQENSEVESGLPLTFSPAAANERTILLSTDLNVAFSAATTCVQSTVWRLRALDESSGRRYVVSGGVEGNPGPGTLSNWFKIEKYGRDYKLVFCPTVCNFCKVICGDLGVFVEDGKRWIGLSDQAFPVMFKKTTRAM